MREPWIPCEVCGRLGWKIAVAPPKHVAFSFDNERPLASDVITAAACDEHRAVVEMRYREQGYPPARRDRVP